MSQRANQAVENVERFGNQGDPEPLPYVQGFFHAYVDGGVIGSLSRVAAKDALVDSFADAGLEPATYNLVSARYDPFDLLVA